MPAGVDSPRSDTFSLLGPSKLVVTGKDGKPSKGEAAGFVGGAVSLSGHTAYRRLDIRKFKYSDSVVELRAKNLSPGKTAVLR